MIKRKNRTILYYYLLSLLLQTASLYSQNSIFDHSALSDTNYISRSFSRKDSQSVQLAILKEIQKLHKEGYLSATAIEIFSDSTFSEIHIHKGHKYKYIHIRTEIINKEKEKSGHSTLDLNISGDISTWHKFAESKIHNWANNGYPFAKVEWKNPIIHADSFVANYLFKPGPKISFGKMEQKSQVLFRPKLLAQICNFKKGEPFSQLKVERISEKINALPYVVTEYDPRLLFLGSEASVWIYNKKKSANIFDFLIGLNPESGISNKKYRITGEAKLELWNSLKLGEVFQFKFENLQVNSPQLNLGLHFPYLVYLPIGISYQFRFQKFEETHFNLQNKINLGYPYKEKHSIGISFIFEQSNILQFDTSFLRSTLKLPTSLDYKTVYSGISYQMESLDYRYNPRKGISASFEFLIGTKRNLVNSILSSSFSEIYPQLQSQYDSLNLNKEQIRSTLSIQYYIPISKRQVVKLANQSNILYAQNNILTNELILLGGYKTLRGFDENFFQSNRYSIWTTEYRFLLDKNGYINAFYDVGNIHKPGSNSPATEGWYQGLGVGIQFQTKVGNFNMQFAVGKSKKEAFDFRNGKIHFGYNSLF